MGAMSAGSAGRNAFVVSWDEDDAINLASMLSEAGWIVALEHSDGNRAWKRIKEGRPDIVVVDFARRPSHSRELLRAMGQRKHTSTIPIVKVGGDEGVPVEELMEAVASASA
jgi:CheY-like chemotaxis protein